MNITKLPHACLIVEESGARLVIDPSTMFNFDEQFPTPDNVAAVVVTHSHFDHYGSENIKKIIAKNPNAHVLASHETVAKMAEDLPDLTNVAAVDAGSSETVGAFTLNFFGGRHAHIVDGDDRGDNVGVVVNGQLVYPGDSFDLPDPATVTKEMVLAVPTSGPWLKVGDSVRYLHNMLPAPKTAFATHDALNSADVNEFEKNYLTTACEEIGANFLALSVGESWQS